MIALACLFVGLSQIIFILGANVFKSAGYGFLWHAYFGSRHFKIISDSILFFIGLHICQQNIQIIYNLRVIVVRVMHYLFPLLVIISIIYFLLILTNTFFYRQSVPISLMVTIPLIIFGILFFNAYIQDAEDNSFMPTSYNVFLKIYRVILFILSIIVANHIRETYLFDINILVYLLYGLSLTSIYFVTMILPKNTEFKYIKIGNIYSALLYVFALFILNIPNINFPTNH